MFNCSMKSLVVFFLLSIPFLAISQQEFDSNPSMQKADSIVAFFLGDEIFKRYVKENRISSPGTLRFRYEFKHPEFSPESVPLLITFDPSGIVVADKMMFQLFRIEQPNDSTWITAKQALNICREQARRIKKRSLRLALDSSNVSFENFERTHNFRDIVPGELVWKVDGEVIFRGEKYSGTFDVNVFTGRVTRRFAIPWD